MKYSFGRQVLPSMALMCAALAVLAIPMRARAQFAGTASATGTFESNSNVFAVQSGMPTPMPTESRRSDTDFNYGASFNGTYQWGRQQLHASVSTTEYDYQHFSELDHNEYTLGIGLNWKIGDPWDGSLNVARSHTMVPTYDLTGVQQELSVQTSQSESALVGFRVNSNWKLQGSVNRTETDQPLANAPDLKLVQDSGSASINYVGISGLSTGLAFSYSPGSYSGSNVAANGATNPTFDQSSVSLTANYVHIRTTFGASLGYSRRTSSDGSDATSGVTGSFSLNQQLTPKTALTVNISRAINSYFLNAGSEIDTTAGANITWQATYKVSASFGYTYTYRDYPGQGNDPVGTNRIDRQQYVTFGVIYQPRRWLSIRPYANYQTRSSNFVGGEFNQSVVGISFTVTPPVHPVQGLL